MSNTNTRLVQKKRKYTGDSDSFWGQSSSFEQPNNKNHISAKVDRQAQLQRLKQNTFDFSQIALRSSPQEGERDTNIKIPRGGIGPQNGGWEKDAHIAGSIFAQSLQRSSQSPSPKDNENNQNINSSLQLKTGNQQNHTTKFWQPGSIVPNLQAKPGDDQKNDQKESKWSKLKGGWSKFKRAMPGKFARGVGIGTVGGVGIGTGTIKAGLLGAGALLAGLGPIGWGILGGAAGLAGIAGLGYLGYKGYKRYKQGKEREKNANKQMRKEELKKGDILLYGGKPGINAVQAAVSVLRGLFKIATLHLRGGIKDFIRMKDASVGHVAIYVGNGQIADATNDGFAVSDLYDDPAWVYRSKNAQLAKDASEIAKNWHHAAIEYGTGKSVISAVRDSKFEGGAHKRAVRLALDYYFAQKRRQMLHEDMNKWNDTWGHTEIDNAKLAPDHLFCSEAGISLYQAAAYKEKVKKIVEDNIDKISRFLGGNNKPKTKTFDDIVNDIAKQIDPSEINKYDTLHLDSKNTTPQRLAAKLDKWSLDSKKTGWSYVGLYNHKEDQLRQSEEQKRQEEQQEERRRKARLGLMKLKQNGEINDKEFKFLIENLS